MLEKVLGEGEFGKVLKAQILDLPGKKGYSPAAVKMLKGRYSFILTFRTLILLKLQDLIITVGRVPLIDLGKCLLVFLPCKKSNYVPLQLL